MKGYTDGLRLTKLTFGQVVSARPSAVTAGATRVTFSVTAKVADGTWT
ncbi:hypothetical protein [Streptomyces lomondensis]|nr:hypothetical protein [Streptomyces lomondensis]MCF0076385.1 hypothetical protein [Streptomyces lomondensis]